MAAVLRLAAMALVSLAGFFGMRPSRLAGECHTDVTPQALPRRKSDPTTKETHQAVRHDSRTIVALMLSRTPSVRPSKHEGVLTAACGESSLGKARQRRIPRIPVLEARELSASPTAYPTGSLGTRRLPSDLIRGLAEDDREESLRRRSGRTHAPHHGHIAPI